MYTCSLQKSEVRSQKCLFPEMYIDIMGLLINIYMATRAISILNPAGEIESTAGISE